MRKYPFVLVAVFSWSVFAVPRISKPFRGYHDAYSGCQEGAFAHNHLKLGLGVTRGFNVWAVDYRGKPIFYYSYSPLACWLMALPMLAGVPFEASVKLVTFLFSVWFLIGLWTFARNVWGYGVANVAVAVAALLPVVLRYAMSAIWESMALGATFSTLALLTSSRPRDRRWFLATALCGTVAVLLSWLNWLLLLPALWFERRTRKTQGLLRVAAVVVLTPAIIQTVGILVSGVTFGGALQHLRERLGGGAMRFGGPPISHLDLLHRFLVWSFTTPAFYGFMASGIAVGTLFWALLVRLRRKRLVPGDGWLWLLAAYGIPFTLLAPNMAGHDFFLLLFAPLLAICSGVAVSLLLDHAQVQGRPNWRFSLGGAVLVLAIFATATWPARGDLRFTSTDYQMRDLLIALGQMVDRDTVILASSEVAGTKLDRWRLPLTLRDRDLPLPPNVGGLTAKTAYVCLDAQERAELERQLGPVAKKIIIEYNGDLEPLPPGGMRREFGAYTVVEYRQGDSSGRQGGGKRP